MLLDVQLHHRLDDADYVSTDHLLQVLVFEDGQDGPDLLDEAFLVLLFRDVGTR